MKTADSGLSIYTELYKQHSNATRIIHSRVLSREHRAEPEFRRGIAAINNLFSFPQIPTECITFARAFDSWAHSCVLNFGAPTDRDQETAFNNYKGSLQMWYIDLIQKINKQVLHDFVLFHQRK